MDIRFCFTDLAKKYLKKTSCENIFSYYLYYQTYLVAPALHLIPVQVF